jgi:membrane peptidoglycan carboxypeptidase
MFGRDAIFRDGLVVTTSLDLDLYNESNTILERWIREFEGVSNSKNGAVTVIDPKTGEILVMVGSRDYFREDIEGKNNNATALNSPGSAFKPFVYLTSFLRLGWGPGTTILDTPISIPQSDGTVFTPTNPGRNFQGSITIRNALGNSLNIPPIKTAMEVGVSNVVAQAKKMGFTSLTGFYGPAIATGGVDITALDLSYGYSVLAAGGVMNGQEPLVRHRAGERTVDPISILKVTDSESRVRFDVEPRRKSERIVGADYAYLVSTILSDGSAQCLTFGCGGITIPGRQAATKTGTSEPFDPKGPNAGKIGDTWAFGYTPELVVGIWAGNSNNAPVDHIYSTSISFRAMRDVMQMVFAGRPSTPFVRPADVVEASVCMPSGLKPTDICGRRVTDIFAKASVPTKDDDWWKRVRIDTRNNLLAAPDTPPQFIEEKVMLVPPGATPESLKAFADQGYAVAPTETSTAGNVGSDLSALITSPAPGFNASGFVQVTGRATSDRFNEYRLEYGVGAAPRSWSRIAQSTSPVSNGTLGIWDTARLEPGIYTIRLVVEDGRRGEITSTVSVFVGEPVATPGATPRVTPTPRRN